MSDRDFDQKIVADLKEAICAEAVAGRFYGYIAESADNGYIRRTFKMFSRDEAGKHKESLQNRLKEITGESFEPDIEQMDVIVNISKFTLASVARVAHSAEARAIEFYTQARAKDTPEYRPMYDSIINDEKAHRSYLAQEQLFEQERQEFKDSLGLRLFSLLKPA